MPIKLSGLLGASTPKASLFSSLQSKSKLIQAALGGSSSKGNSDAAVPQISGNYFRFKLERHLEDVSKGRGHLSKGVSGELRQKSHATSSYLSQTDPSVLSQYSAYSTAFAYDKQARFVTSINDVTNTVKTINSQAEQEDFEKFVQSLVDAHEAAQEVQEAVGQPEFETAQSDSDLV